jgi:cyclophilin family peptidyl-prolyl cis-trans isomerase
MIRRWCLFFFLAVAGTFIRAQSLDASVLKIKAPETFRAVFTTTRGDFEIEAYRKWSPLGVDRLYQLISTGFYNKALLFRVEPGFVVQFGVSASRTANRFWDPKKLPDEPMLQKNTKATISFARGGRNERATQIFINLSDNTKLDTVTRGGIKGYTTVARVTKGMQTIQRFYAGYGKQPIQIQDSLYKYGNFYFEERFPQLDQIIHARIVK